MGQADARVRQERLSPPDPLLGCRRQSGLLSAQTKLPLRARRRRPRSCTFIALFSWRFCSHPGPSVPIRGACRAEHSLACPHAYFRVAEERNDGVADVFVDRRPVVEGDLRHLGQVMVQEVGQVLGLQVWHRARYGTGTSTVGRQLLNFDAEVSQSAKFRGWPSFGQSTECKVRNRLRLSAA